MMGICGEFLGELEIARRHIGIHINLLFEQLCSRKRHHPFQKGNPTHKAEVPLSREPIWVLLGSLWTGNRARPMLDPFEMEIQYRVQAK